MSSEGKQPGAEGPSPSIKPPRLAGVRVLVAEDEPILLMVLEEVLAELGCVVVATAARVDEALASIETHAFDVALLDGKLADGYIDPVVDVLVARGTPIVVASGLASSHFSDRFADAVLLRKPFTDDLLEKALVQALEQGQVQLRSR